MHGKNRGENNGAAKLTKADVKSLRTQREQGLSYRELAGIFGIHKDSVKGIVHGETWGWLD